MSDGVRLGPSRRWRPARAGIRNIWEYDDQVFEFADGRLVLRGPNGSGKSNALALLVPFVLDGVMAASRMDSLSGGRSMKTLLLCLAEDEHSRRFRHEQRTGYVWLEFERDGEHLTVGCGARASTQRDAEAWFFVTSRRPGIDLDLAPGGVPLSRGGLADAIGQGAVHDSVESHRVSVDRALFGLGPHRYRNLLELLLVLRRPHLAGKLNLEHLSKVLGDGLPALDDQVVADVAASFEDLEAVQQDLRRLQEAHGTVQSFLPVYRGYLRAVGRARAVAATEAARALRAARHQAAEAEKAAEAALAALERLGNERLACDERREVAEQRQRAVLESPAYRDATSLVEVEDRARDAERQRASSGERLASADEARRAAAGELDAAERALARASSETERAFTGTADAADQAGVAWPFSRDDLDAADLAPAVRSLGTRRRGDIAAVRGALVEADASSAHARATLDAATAASEDADRAEDRRLEAAAALVDARSELAGEVQRWVAASAVEELASVVGAAETVGEPGAPSLADVAAEALRPRREELAARDARAEDLVASLSAERDELAEERRKVVDDPVPSPERLATRPADRSRRDGAPLFACCDFVEGVPAGERAGLEAAIEAAGLLDAWIGETSTDLDAWLLPGPPVAGPSLADVLVATPPFGSGLTDERIREVLSSIALADTGVAVLPDGRFHLGPLSGRFAKGGAEFVGATAREQRRERLLAALDERLDDVARRIERAREDRAGFAAERRHLDEVVAALPSPSAVHAARESLVSAIAAARATGEAAARAASVARLARNVAEATADRLRAVAAERGLPVSAGDLDEAEILVSAYERLGHDLLDALRRRSDRRAERDKVAERASRAAEQWAKCDGEHEEQRRHEAGLRARVEQLRSQLGADADAPLRDLAAIEDELRLLRAESDRLRDEASGAAERRGRALAEHETAVAAVAAHESSLLGASARLDVLRRGDVWSVVAAGPAPPEEPGELASVVVAATAEAAADADDNALQRAYRQLLDDLGRGFDPSLSYVDHVAVVEVTSDAGTFSVLRLADELGRQVARQQELLTERDREIFERHLLSRVSEGLRELLNDADELVERVNGLLADRPTASGKSIQLRWEPDGANPAVRGALGLLRRTPDLLGPDEREQLRRFFSTAIAQRRAEDPASGYAEILRHVLDYRAWHSFALHVRSAGGGVQRLTRTLYRSLSGGEQAVVLHLPLFAAAAAHYDAAGASSPRLIALDEAFAGIDEGMRAELMGLLVRFDLDIVLTGHELWGTYEEVPSLMVYDLLRQPPLEGVSAFAVRWDGATMAEV